MSSAPHSGSRCFQRPPPPRPPLAPGSRPATGTASRSRRASLRAAAPDDGPPVQALERMLAAAWRHLARYGAMAQAVAEQLSPEAVARTHEAAHQTIGALVERGRADGSFRTDLPAGWLVTA